MKPKHLQALVDQHRADPVALAMIRVAGLLMQGKAISAMLQRDGSRVAPMFQDTFSELAATLVKLQEWPVERFDSYLGSVEAALARDLADLLTARADANAEAELEQSVRTGEGASEAAGVIAKAAGKPTLH